MCKSKWLEDVSLALRRAGLSPAYIRRFTDELSDHFDDLSEESMSMDANTFSARLGAPDDLASRAAAELRRRTYAGRHPLMMFVAAPLPTAVLLLVGLCLLFMAVLSVLPESADDQIPVWAEGALWAVVWSMRSVPFVAGGILFCQLAKRAACSARWSFVACALLAVLAGLFVVNVTMPTAGPDSGMLMMGFAIPPGPTQWLQAAAPIAIWLLYARREFRSRTFATAA
jgi:hypothetical protein